MSNLEKKIEAIYAVLVSEGDDDWDKAMENLKQIMAAGGKAKDTEDVIRDTFLEMGAPDHLIGYDYAVSAIKLIVEDRYWLVHITSGIYPQISNEFKTVPCRVERGIRHLIEHIFDRGNKKVLENYFGTMINPKTGKVTNGEFIARMANIVKKKMRNM